MTHSSDELIWQPVKFIKLTKTEHNDSISILSSEKACIKDIK